MELKDLSFHISGDNYEKVCQYRFEMDLRVIRNQIERRGHAILIWFRGEPGFSTVSEIPGIGEAVPWYGTAGTGYHYIVRPMGEGCLLRVENIASGVPLICTEPLPPLELHLPEATRRVLTESKRTPFSILGGGDDAFDENVELREIVLQISKDDFSHLEKWSHWGKELSEYEFTFSPLKVGTPVMVKDIASDELVDLTKDVNW